MYDVHGTICHSYEEACIVAGVDTPAQIKAEIEWNNICDEVESLTRPVVCWPCRDVIARTGYGVHDDADFPF